MQQASKQWALPHRADEPTTRGVLTRGLVELYKDAFCCRQIALWRLVGVELADSLLLTIKVFVKFSQKTLQAHLEYISLAPDMIMQRNDTFTLVLTNL